MIREHLQYLSYIIRHKWFVFRAAWPLGIPWLALVHDLSKFCPDEWEPYKRYFYGNYPEFAKMPVWFKSEYFGPTKESVGDDFDAAWLRHIHRNRHHWQYWVLREDSGEVKCLPMPDRYRREMLADWRGAGKAQGYGDNTVEWYLKNRNKMQLHPDTRSWIEEQLRIG